MSRLAFSKKNRILKRSDFLQCYSKGTRYTTRSLIFFILPTNVDDWRVGFAVSKKIGQAVVRNRVKRLLREIFRLNQADIPLGMDLAVVPKKSLRPAKLNFVGLEKELRSLLDGLSKTWGKHNS